MRSLTILLAAVPLFGCYVDGGYAQPPVQAQVQVDTPPPQPVTAQVDVNAQPVDPNAQQPAADQQADQVPDTDPSAVSDFRDVLAPYGTWVDDPQYGTIWQPNPAVVGADFTPYMTAGHWVYDNDYTWVSDYDWGWAPFHYGRWVPLPGRGWNWIPGKEYAGAWVTWRNGDDGYGFVGWAPTAPSYYWRGGVAVNLATPWFPARYSYIDTGSLFVPSFRDRVIRDPGRITVIEGRTRPFAPSGSVVVGGNTRMTVRGPAPTHLGLNVATLPHAPPNNAGMTRAYQFSHQRAGQPIQQAGFHTATPGHPPIEQHGTIQQTPQQHGQIPQHPINEQHATTGQPQQQGTIGQHPVTEQHATMQGQTPQQPVTEQHATMQQQPTQQHGEIPQHPINEQHAQPVQAQPQPTQQRRPTPPPPVQHHH